jgi:lipopolysaccharide biosynthesis protein
MRVLKNLYYKRRSKAYCLKEWDGTAKIPDAHFTLTFFSHFDSKERIHPYVVEYLRELHANNCLIIFISTSLSLNEASIDAIKPYCYKIIMRTNIGLDFGSWRMAFDMHGSLLHKADSLLFTNDSCFGPVYSLKTIFENFKKHDCVSGITLSNESKKHLQSYFLYIPKRVFTKDYFLRFMQSVGYLRDKVKIIRRYEKGFSKMLLRRGEKLHTWVDPEVLNKKHPEVNVLKNLTLWHCDVLLINRYSPFVKKAVFKESKHLIPTQYQEVIHYLKMHHPAHSNAIVHFLGETSAV